MIHGLVRRLDKTFQVFFCTAVAVVAPRSDFPIFWVFDFRLGFRARSRDLAY